MSSARATFSASKPRLRVGILRITNTLPSSPKPKACYFEKLPPELREKIYAEVFRSFPTNLLLQERPLKRKRRNTIQCKKLEGRRRKDSVDWRKTNTGILFANRECYTQASGYLYGRMTVTFDKLFGVNYAFLRQVLKPTLQCIKRVTIQHMTTIRHRGGGNSTQITKNEFSETAMWTRIASSLPNLDTLNIKLTVNEYEDFIVPSFDDDLHKEDSATFYSIEQLNDIHWLQPLKAFCALKDKLQRVRVDIWDWPSSRHCSGRYGCFIGYKYYKVVSALPWQSYNDAQEEVAGKWCCFCKALHGSMGRAIRDIILGRNDPWAEHLGILTKYEMFRADQHRSTGLFRTEREERRAVHCELYDGCRKKRPCQHGY